MREYALAKSYLPHESPMVLIEEVISVDAERAHCRVKVDTSGILAPFLDQDGHLPGWFALEMIAQTVGVWSGWHGHHDEGAAPKLGMLLGARAFFCHQPLFASGSVLDINVSLIMQDGAIGSFEGAVSVDGVVQAGTRVNTWQPSTTDLQQIFQ
jgi:predicted hotdog family 3-hydroxylacyl-ACP dehydratase